MTSTYTTPHAARAAALDTSELADAETFFSTFADGNDERATNWRRGYYLDLRTGWNHVARRYQDNFVTEHAKALELVAKNCPCLHDWQQTGVYDNTNRVLGTYKRGHHRACTKCAATDVAITSRNNWSGD